MDINIKHSSMFWYKSHDIIGQLGWAPAVNVVTLFYQQLGYHVVDKFNADEKLATITKLKAQARHKEKT